MTTYLALTYISKVNHWPIALRSLCRSRSLSAKTAPRHCTDCPRPSAPSVSGPHLDNPQRRKVDGQWQTTGYRIMIGISAWWAGPLRNLGEYLGRHFAKATDERASGLALVQTIWRCAALSRRKTGQEPSEYHGNSELQQTESRR